MYNFGDRVWFFEDGKLRFGTIKYFSYSFNEVGYVTECEKHLDSKEIISINEMVKLRIKKCYNDQA